MNQPLSLSPCHRRTIVRSLALPLTFALAALGGCSAESLESSTETARVYPEASLETVTSQGGLTFEVRTQPAQPPGRGRTSVELRVTDHDGAPVDDLALEVVPWMPDMGHGASTDPSVEPGGEGRYEIFGVNMPMPGLWELRTTITGPTDDRATIDFQIP